MIDLHLDPARRHLRCGEIEGAIGPRVCRLLAELLRAPGVVVTEGELRAVLWPSVHYQQTEFAGRNLRQIVRIARRMLARIGSTARIRNVPGAGYWIE